MAVYLILCITAWSHAQETTSIPDLTKINDTAIWELQNRNITGGEFIYLDANEGDGLLWLKDSNFSNGTIALDIKGANNPGKSFVGLAFHGLDEKTYDVIYFRAFNFKNPERSHHAVQYISHPDYTWYKLREEFPEKYENPVTPVPEPDDWFHATIVVQHPVIQVFVNHSKTPSLVVEQLNSRKKGKLGFWVGHGSDGSFKNLIIKSN